MDLLCCTILHGSGCGSSPPPHPTSAWSSHLGGSAHSIHVTHTKHSCLFVSGLVLPECVQGDDETQSNALNCDVIAGYVQRISVWVQFSVNERSTRSISMAGFDQLIDNRCCLFCAFVLLGTPARAGGAASVSSWLVI